MTTYIRVKVKATGHQIDIVESHFDPEKHIPVKRWLPSKWPRRSKYKVQYGRTDYATRALDAHLETSAPEAVEGSALPIQAGTVEEEVGP